MISRIAFLFAAILLLAISSSLVLAHLLHSKNPLPQTHRHHSFAGADTDDNNAAAAAVKKGLPANFDWADHGFNLPIWGSKTECGGLTVAAAVADAISAADFVSNKLARPTRCSAAQLIDCFDVSQGCNGGFPDGTLTSLMKNSSGLLSTDADYPWMPVNNQGGQGPCRASSTGASGWKPCANKVTGYNNLPNDEDALQEILYREGPLMVVTSPGYLQSYTGGIVQGKDCAFSYYEHVLLVTGWGVRYDGTNGKYVKYWRARSDFGEEWGEQGNVNLEFGVNCTGFAGWARSAKVQKV